MTRPSDYTRQQILKAAVALFAERGYDATSVRAIVAKARVNQAAINYHFKGKEGLYVEVLKVAFDGYLRLDNFDFETLKDMPREEALRSFVHQQLRPLLAREQMSRYIRIFAWENVRPSKVLAEFVATGAMPFLASATRGAALPAAGGLGPGRHVRRDRADRSMQRVRAQSRAVRAAAIQFRDRRGLRRAPDRFHQRPGAQRHGATGLIAWSSEAVDAARKQGMAEMNAKFRAAGGEVNVKDANADDLLPPS